MILAALLLSIASAAPAPTLALEPVVSGLEAPVAIAHARDSRLFIVQQNGVIRLFDPPLLRAEPFLDIRTLVLSGGERGLLGLAFHPRYQENGRFFVNYTDRSGHTVIAEYTRSAADPNRADPASARRLLYVEQPYPNHNGGQLEFGPDGYLYIGLGDGGSGGDPGNRAQNPAELLGKMLRLDVDGGQPYAIPPSNPFAGRAGTRGEIWASGLRNPWRFSFDSLTGDLWIADVGQQRWEEVNFQPASSSGGENYGWRRMEGAHCYNPTSNCNVGSLVLPAIEYEHATGGCSVTGGYVYRGWRSPALRGLYLYGDYCTGYIWAATRDENGTVNSTRLFDVPFFLSTFGQDWSGELYVADHVGGAIYRLYDATPHATQKRRSVRK